MRRPSFNNGMILFFILVSLMMIVFIAVSAQDTEDYSIISDEDLEAVIAYIQSLEPIDNEVPAPAFEDEAFVQYADED